MGPSIDLTDKRFTRLIVIKNLGKRGRGYRWLCKCDCGKEVEVLGESLRSGNTTSCGCLHRQQLIEYNKSKKVKHGLTNTKLYIIWIGMKQRCYNVKSKDYKNYGQRGIKICKEWLDDFKTFYEWAITKGYRTGLTIDRINNNGNYEPSNCRWATWKEQDNNRNSNRIITFNGKSQNITEWANELRINRVTLADRIFKRGWSFEKSLRSN